MGKYLYGEKEVTAKNYQEAAEKLFGQTRYDNPQGGGKVPTTYVKRHNGYATVEVYKAGDKQGSYWGVQAAIPHVYEIKRA